VLEYAAALRAVASDSGVFCFCLYLYLDLNASNAVVSGTVMSVTPRPCAPSRPTRVCFASVSISISISMHRMRLFRVRLCRLRRGPARRARRTLWRCLVLLSLALALFARRPARLYCCIHVPLAVVSAIYGVALYFYLLLYPYLSLALFHRPARPYCCIYASLAVISVAEITATPETGRFLISVPK
jgi:hypothetical protein